MLLRRSFAFTRSCTRACSGHAIREDVPAELDLIGRVWCQNLCSRQRSRLDLLRRLEARLGKLRGLEQLFPTEDRLEESLRTLFPAVVQIHIEKDGLIKREGGALVRVCVPRSLAENTVPTGVEPTFSEFIKCWRDRLERGDSMHKVYAPFFSCFRKGILIKPFCIKGEPSKVRLETDYPSRLVRIRVKPASEHFSRDDMFELLREYGELTDIRRESDGTGFSVSFKQITAAIAAKNCLHRAPAVTNSDQSSNCADGGAKPLQIEIEYERFVKSSWLWDQVRNNTKNMIPALLFSLAFAAYCLGVIVDYFRTLAMKFKIANVVSTQYEIEMGTSEAPRLKGFMGKLIESTIRFRQGYYKERICEETEGERRRKESDILLSFWLGNKREKDKLRRWLTSPTDQIMVLTTTNQARLIQEELVPPGGAFFLHVDRVLSCSYNDYQFLREFCSAFGFRAWLLVVEEKINAFVARLLIESSSKEKVVTNETLSVVRHTLFCYSRALERILDMVEVEGGGCDDSYLDPTDRYAPLFVISGFSYYNIDKIPGLFELLVHWAADVTDHGFARVLFVNDISTADRMLKFLERGTDKRDMRTLPDADEKQVDQFLKCHGVDLDADHRKLLGGSFHDLSKVVARLIADKSFAPNASAQDLAKMANKVVDELKEMKLRSIRQLFIRSSLKERLQLWRTIKSLGTPGVEFVTYDTILWSAFHGDQVELTKLLTSPDGSELFLFKHPMIGDSERPLPARIVPRSCLSQHIFQELVQEKAYAAKVLDLQEELDDIEWEEALLKRIGVKSDLQQRKEQLRSRISTKQEYWSDSADSQTSAPWRRKLSFF